MTTTSEHAGAGLQNWETPPELVHQLEREMGRDFVLDAAATFENKKAPGFYDAESDGLSQTWGVTHGTVDGPVYVNPGYARQDLWLAKAHEEARKGVSSCVLVRASTSAKYWRPLVWERASVDFFEGRIAFLHPVTKQPVKGTSFASALCWFGPTVFAGAYRVRCAKTFKLLGRSQ